MKVVLGIEDIELGYLSEHNGKYMFCANGEEVERALKEYSLDMMLFKLNNSGIKVFDKIPYPFDTFLAGSSRPDIMKKSGISKDDSDFVKLYKIAGLNLVRENFDIHRVD